MQDLKYKVGEKVFFKNWAGRFVIGTIVSSVGDGLYNILIQGRKQPSEGIAKSDIIPYQAMVDEFVDKTRKPRFLVKSKLQNGFLQTQKQALIEQLKGGGKKVGAGGEPAFGSASSFGGGVPTFGGSATFGRSDATAFGRGSAVLGAAGGGGGGGGVSAFGGAPAFGGATSFGNSVPFFGADQPLSRQLSEGSAIVKQSLLQKYGPLNPTSNCNELLAEITRFQGAIEAANDTNKQVLSTIPKDMRHLFILPNGNCLLWSYIVYCLFEQDTAALPSIIETFSKPSTSVNQLLKELIRKWLAKSSEFQGGYLIAGKNDLRLYAGGRKQSPDYNSILSNDFLVNILLPNDYEWPLIVPGDYTQLPKESVDEIIASGVEKGKFILQTTNNGDHFHIVLRRDVLQQMLDLPESDPKKSVLCKILGYFKKFITKVPQQVAAKVQDDMKAAVATQVKKQLPKAPHNVVTASASKAVDDVMSTSPVQQAVQGGAIVATSQGASPATVKSVAAQLSQSSVGQGAIQAATQHAVQQTKAQTPRQRYNFYF